MYLNSRVKIPSDKGKISIKSVRGYQYVYYQYDTNYRPERKYNMPKRTTIGKVCKDDPSMMNPNPSYLKFYPDAQLPDFNDTGRSSCLRAGTWIVIDHLIHHYHLQGYLKDIIGEKYGLFLDLAAYTIVTENNAAQYYPDYAYDHPLFTRDMKIYSDSSSVSTFLHDLTRDESISFLNAWNEHRDHRSKIYISYDSTNKKCQAGDIELVEVGHSKTGQSDTIFNMSIAYDRTNREPLFYEAYPGSITDVTQLTEMIEKAKAFGYKHAGFILDRGYFSEANIRFMDDNGYDFVIMAKGMKKMVSQIVLANKGSFEEVYSCMIHEYGIPGTTIAMPVFRGDSKDRYVHIYFNESKAAQEKAQLLQKIDVMEKYLKKHQGDPIHPDAIFSHYFDLIYYHEGQEDEVLQAAARDDVIEQEMKLCGYFCIITSEKMNAKEALLMYKSRDDSEKLFRGDKSYLGERAERVYTIEPFESKIFIEFVALIIRSGIYTSLIELMKEEGKRMNYMTIPAAVKELEKIEMIRYADGDYHLDHAITKTQKEILKAFGMDERTVREKIKSLSVQLSCLEEEHGKKSNHD
jgi:transposase